MEGQVVVVTVPPEKLAELHAEVCAVAGLFYVPRARLRSLAGKFSHVASLVSYVRPYVSCLWAALYAPALST